MRKRMKNIILVILFLFLITSTVFLTYLHFFMADDKDLSGEWTAKLDMTEKAAVTALGWLQDIEAVSVSLEEMEAYMQGLAIEINLSLEQTAHSRGVFRCNVLSESYDACNQAAYEAFATVFRKLLDERLRMAGYTGSTDEDSIETLIVETFGMSTVSYLMSYGPNLLPSLEDLQAQYSGSGTYEITKGILIRQFDTDQLASTKTESYIRKGSSLILSEEISPDHYSVIYTLQQP